MGASDQESKLQGSAARDGQGCTRGCVPRGKSWFTRQFGMNKPHLLCSPSTLLMVPPVLVRRIERVGNKALLLVHTVPTMVTKTLVSPDSQNALLLGSQQYWPCNTVTTAGKGDTGVCQEGGQGSERRESRADVSMSQASGRRGREGMHSSTLHMHSPHNPIPPAARLHSLWRES